MTTKRCTKCGEEKSLDDFSPHPHGKFGKQAKCKPCSAAANLARYYANHAANKERARLRSLEDQRTNPEAKNAARARWRAANPEKELAAKKKWATENPEKHRAAKEAWRKANLVRFNETGKAWKKNHPEAMFKYGLKKYGLTPEKYRELHAKQGGACAICRKVPPGARKLCVDHHHASNKHRSLLCVSCNAGLGNFREDPKLFMAAIDYLVAHGAPGMLEAA
jgi:recombination endonuclease VII